MNKYYLEEHINRVLRDLEEDMLRSISLDDIEIEASYQIELIKKVKGLNHGSYLLTIPFQAGKSEVCLYFSFSCSDSIHLSDICACIKQCILYVKENTVEALKEKFSSVRKRNGCEFLNLLDAITIPSF